MTRRTAAAMTLLLSLLATISIVSNPPAAAALADACEGLAPTLIGTSGDDVLVGTPGNDVIVAGQGSDIVWGNGGDDTICGENGDDQLFGGSGADVVDGGNGNDFLVGESGDDTMFGGNGDDVVFGLSGNDLLLGDRGDDLVGGGSDDDQAQGDRGNDRIIGGDGTDAVDGGRGYDDCASEANISCQVDAADSAPDVAAAVSAPMEPPVDGTFDVTVSAISSEGVALILVYVNDVLIDVATFAGDPTAAELVVAVDSSDLSSGGAAFVAVAVDRHGNNVRSDPAFVDIEREFGPLGPTVVVELNEPTPLSLLEPVILLMDQPVVEWRHQRDAAEPAPVPADIVSRGAAEGIEVLAAPTATVGGFYGRGLAVGDQIDLFLGLAPVPDPLIVAIRFEGELTPRAESIIAEFAARILPVDARVGYEQDFVESLQTAAGRSAAPVIEKPTTLSEQQRWTRAAALAVVDDRVFWPTFGQLDTTEFDIEIERRFWFDETIKRVQFDHDLVFAPGVPDVFGQLDRAYEHDLKISTDALTVGLRPACLAANPLNSWDDIFYAHRSDGVFWETNVPGDANPYFDTDVSDGCGKEDLSVGIRTPEKLDDGLGANQAVAYRFTVVSARGNPDTGHFALSAQRLSRESNAVCFVMGSENCTGLRAGEGDGGFILRSGGQLVPGITLPTCFTWYWPPNGNQAAFNENAFLCDGDSDGDGWDDSIDCAPNDPSINPGAVDFPNDGIDQDCDGSDLIVGQGTLQFTLIWDNANDQDLHVIEPNGTRIWYASPGPTASGGRLDRDDNVGSCGSDPQPGGVENIFWPVAGSSPASGAYEVEIRQFSSCGTPAEWTLEIRDGGVLVVQVSGSQSGTYVYNR